MAQWFPAFYERVPLNVNFRDFEKKIIENKTF